MDHPTLPWFTPAKSIVRMPLPGEADKSLNNVTVLAPALPSLTVAIWTHVPLAPVTVGTVAGPAPVKFREATLTITSAFAVGEMLAVVVEVTEAALPVVRLEAVIAAHASGHARHSKILAVASLSIIERVRAAATGNEASSPVAGHHKLLRHRGPDPREISYRGEYQSYLYAIVSDTADAVAFVTSVVAYPEDTQIPIPVAKASPAEMSWTKPAPLVEAGIAS